MLTPVCPGGANRWLLFSGLDRPDNMDMASFDFDNMQNLDIMALFEWGNFGDQKEADLGKSNIRVQPSWGCACSGGCPHSHCCYHPPQLADS